MNADVDRSEILLARARELAREPESDNLAGEFIDVVQFTIANEQYAIESKYVSEIVKFEDLTPVPCTPAFVSGIINVRGQIISVIDLKVLFELPLVGLTDRSRAIIVASDDMRFGILLDAVQDTRCIYLAEIQPGLPTLTGVRCKYLKGVTNDRIVILDGAKILAGKDLVVNEEVGI